VKYQKEEILRLLKAKADELGRFPKKKEINEDSRLPSSETYRKYYGNLPQLAVAIGLPACQGKKRRAYYDEDLLNTLKKLAKEFNRMPTVAEIGRCPDLPCASTIHRYFGSLPLLARKLGLESKVRYSRVYTNDELIAHLKAFADKIGKTPTAALVKADKDMPPFGAYKQRFGSYSNAVRLTGYIPRERRRREEISLDKFKSALLNFYNEHNRVPSASEFMKVCKYYLVRLDGERAKWNQLVYLSGLPIHTGTWSMKLHRKTELFIKSLLTKAGYTVEEATIKSSRSPYDLLVDGNIHIQVSASTPRKKQQMEWHFNIPQGKEFEYLIGVGYADNLNEEAVFVFPIKKIGKVGVVSIPLNGESSKYLPYRVKDIERIGEYIK
jgi:hypothetical protein